MLKSKLKLSTSIILIATVSGLSGCSVLSKVGKSARNLTSFGGNSATDVDETLVIPPSLKVPANVSNQPTTAKQAKRTVAQRSQQPVQNAKRFINLIQIITLS